MLCRKVSNDDFIYMLASTLLYRLYVSTCIDKRFTEHLKSDLNLKFEHETHSHNILPFTLFEIGKRV